MTTNETVSTQPQAPSAHEAIEVPELGEFNVEQAAVAPNSSDSNGHNGSGHNQLPSPDAPSEASPNGHYPVPANSSASGSRGPVWAHGDPRNIDTRWQRTGETPVSGSQSERPHTVLGSANPEGALFLSRGNYAELIRVLGIVSAHGGENDNPALNHAVQAAGGLLGLVESQADDTTRLMAQGPYYSSPR